MNFREYPSVSGGAGFIYLWLIVLALFFLVRVLYDIWYHKYEGFTDWWYKEINKKLGAGDWYYKRFIRRLSDNMPD